jgi:hypothetical protein
MGTPTRCALMLKNQLNRLVFGYSNRVRRLQGAAAPRFQPRHEIAILPPDIAPS